MPPATRSSGKVLVSPEAPAAKKRKIIQSATSPPDVSSRPPQQSPAINLKSMPGTGNPFKDPVNLFEYFKAHHKGVMVIDRLSDNEDQDALHEAVKICIDLLEERCGSLKFGRFKRTMLTNIALSLAGTFPTLSTPGQGDVRYSRLYEVSGGTERGPVFNRFTHQQKRLKRKQQDQEES